MITKENLRRALRRKRFLLGALTMLAALTLVAAACGEDATATPVPQPTATPVPGVQPTATPVPQPTATPVPSTGLRPMSQWTEENPATLAEIEAELEKFRGKSLVFASWGGAYQAAQRQAYLVPFQNKFGIQIVEESPPSIAKLRTMAETGNIQWHVVDLGGDLFFQSVAANSLEPLDFSINDITNHLEVVKEGKPYAAGGGITWSTGLAYSSEAVSETPDGWDDFFDLDTFSGKRGVWDFWGTNLQFALMGKNPQLMDSQEGRDSIARLTEAQIQEALDFWEAFKAVASGDLIFWATGSDCPQLLLSGELTMCSAWNGRIFDAAQEGAPLVFCWECGHVLQTDVFVMPRGLKAQDEEAYILGNLFMAWTGAPEINVQMSQYITYGPMNLASLPFLGETDYDRVRDELPSSPANLPFAIILDEQWTGEVGDRLQEQWVGFQQS